jgi:hypothetical protein
MNLAAELQGAAAGWFAVQLRFGTVQGSENTIRWGRSSLFGDFFAAFHAASGSTVECGCDCTGNRYVRFEGQRGSAARRGRIEGPAS